MGMRWLRLRLGTLTYEDWLLFCFTAGIFCGVFFYQGCFLSEQRYQLFPMPKYIPIFSKNPPLSPIFTAYFPISHTHIHRI